MSELKPCPFCAGEAHYQSAFPDIPICSACSAVAFDGEKWNTRALGPALDTVIEAVEGMPVPDTDGRARALVLTLHNIRALRDSARTEAGENEQDQADV